MQEGVRWRGIWDNHQVKEVTHVSDGDTPSIQKGVKTLSFPDGHAGPSISSRDKVRSGLPTGAAKTPFYSDDFVVLLKT